MPERTEPAASGRGTRQFLLYALCGGSGTVLDFALYALLVASGTWHQAANVAGYLAGTLLSFALNRIVTFGVLDRPARRLAAFLGVAFLGWVASACVLWGLIDGFGLGPIPAKLAAIVVVVAIQYTLNARYTFRQ